MHLNKRTVVTTFMYHRVFFGTVEILDLVVIKRTWLQLKN